MKNLIFIRQKTYNDSLVGEQLLSILDRGVLIDSDWCCFTKPLYSNDIAVNVCFDNMVYMLNNFLFAKLYDNIIVGMNYDENGLINNIIEHLNIPSQMHVTVFTLTNTEGADIENYELCNKEYASDYYTLPSANCLVKQSYIDTTSISAFKIAKIIEALLLK